jgi:hypothetical protein
MSTPRLMPLLRHASLLSAAVVLAAGAALAQSTPSHDSSSSPSFSESSSSAALPAADEAEGAALPTASGASSGAAAAGQERGGYHSRNLFSHLTYEAGGGANGPTSDSSPYITWGGNFTVGAGYRFNPYVSLLTEYQFIDDKLPGAIIAETGSNGGHAHIWSLTLDPVVDLLPKSTNSVYVTGEGGFYRKVTSFTDPQQTYYCDYFYCYPGVVNAVVGHFSSNQGGWSIGGGFTHRLGGIYGDGKAKLFAEVRYLDVLTPAVTTSANGLPVTSVGADTKVIPITLGVRF